MSAISAAARPAPTANSVDRGDDDLLAVDDVVDQVGGFLGDRRDLLEVLGLLQHHVEVAARRERLAGTGDDSDPGGVVGLATPCSAPSAGACWWH
jgi:hypothetical protein